jgi:hypothetical protein
MFHWHSEVVAFVVPSHTRILLLFYRPLFVCLFESFSFVIVLYIPWTSGAGIAYPSGAPEFTPVLSWVHVTRSLFLYVCFVDRCLFFCTFSFGHCVFCSSSIYGFWLPLWYLHTLLTRLLIITFGFLKPLTYVVF